jgi:ABC-2 type transport system permease protein
MRKLLALTWKEFMQLRRDPITLRLIIFIPLFQTMVFGYAINFDVKHLRTVVLDESRSFESRELVAKLTASDYFEIVGSVSSYEELRQAMDSGRAAVALAIDRDFGRDVRRGRPAHALLVVNASDTTTASPSSSMAGSSRRARRTS